MCDMEILKADWQVLAGFWEEATAIEYTRGQGVPLKDSEFKKLKGQMTAARDYVDGLPNRRGDLPTVREFSDQDSKKLEALESESTFQEHLKGIDSWEYAWVELAKVIVFQPNLNLRYVQSLEEKAPKVGDIDELLRFCLPSKKDLVPEEVTIGFDQTTNTFSIVTENLDFRILGNVQGQDPLGVNGNHDSKYSPRDRNCGGRREVFEARWRLREDRINRKESRSLSTSS